jgi:hypothetical protein
VNVAGVNDLTVLPGDLAIAILVMATGCVFQAAVGIGMALLVAPLLAVINTECARTDAVRRHCVGRVDRVSPPGRD